MKVLIVPQGSEVVAFVKDGSSLSFLKTPTGSICGLDGNSVTEHLEHIIDAMTENLQEMRRLASLSTFLAALNSAAPIETLDGKARRSAEEAKRMIEEGQSMIAPTEESIKQLTLLLGKSREYDKECGEAKISIDMVSEVNRLDTMGVEFFDKWIKGEANVFYEPEAPAGILSRIKGGISKVITRNKVVKEVVAAKVETPVPPTPAAPAPEKKAPTPKETFAEHIRRASRSGSMISSGHLELKDGKLTPVDENGNPSSTDAVFGGQNEEMLADIMTLAIAPIGDDGQPGPLQEFQFRREEVNAAGGVEAFVKKFLAEKQLMQEDDTLEQRGSGRFEGDASDLQGRIGGILDAIRRQRENGGVNGMRMELVRRLDKEGFTEADHREIANKYEFLCPVPDCECKDHLPLAMRSTKGIDNADLPAKVVKFREVLEELRGTPIVIVEKTAVANKFSSMDPKYTSFMDNLMNGGPNQTRH